MNNFRRIALATALLGGGIGVLAATQAHAANEQRPVFVDPTPAPQTFTAVAGTPVEFDVKALDADAVAPTIEYAPGDNTTAAEIVHTTTATDTYTRTDHVAFTAPAPGTYGFTAIATDGELSDRRVYYFTVAEGNHAPVIDSAPSDNGLTPAYTVYFGQPISVHVTGHDVDPGDSACFELPGNQAGATLTNSVCGTSPSANFNYSPLTAGAGTHEIDLVLTDDKADTTQVFHIRVLGRQPTALFAHPALIDIPGRRSPLPLTVSATLLGLGGHPIPGQPVVFSLRGTYLCTGITNADGYASCQAVISAVLATLNLDYDATYFGDQIRQPSASDGRIINLLGLPLP